MCWAAQAKRVPCIARVIQYSTCVNADDTSGEGTTLQLFGNLEVST